MTPGQINTIRAALLITIACLCCVKINANSAETKGDPSFELESSGNNGRRFSRRLSRE